MNNPNTVYWTCSLAGWVGVCFKLRDLLHSPRSPLKRAVCITLALASTSMFCAAPSSVAVINKTTGVPNLAALFVYIIIVMISASAHVMLAYWLHPLDRARQAARRWMLTYAVLITVMIALFAAGDAPVERRLDFDTYYASAPYLREFILLYLVALAAATAAMMGLCWKWATLAGRPWLSRGLRMNGIGAAGGLAFSLAKLTAVIARWCGTDWDGLSSDLAPRFAAPATIFTAIGVALPSWGPYLTRMRNRATRHTAYRELYPLWNALRQAAPAIVPAARIPRGDFELRLIRRLAEINDGRLALRSYIDPRVKGLALRLGQEAGLTGSALHAVVEAARLKSAVADKARAMKFPPDAAADHPQGGTDGIGELSWLVELSRAFVNSPVVSDVLVQLQKDREEDALDSSQER
ncbi:MAB_1171c family putative transporter [Streptomyces sp. 5-6(2022)]|uniref:MAB_1171c family putative transporter n=1 Tax=Streptomyces sp. 5-6(2022) TaxID=2936510 RepID=UPI0031BA0848